MNERYEAIEEAIGRLDGAFADLATNKANEDLDDGETQARLTDVFEAIIIAACLLVKAKGH